MVVITMKKNLKNNFKLEILSKSENESFARQTATFFIAQLDPDLSDLADLRTAVSEAVTNCIIHAYKNTAGIIYIEIGYNDEREVFLKIKDKGCGINDIEKAMTPLYTGDNSGERGGMGFTIMKSFTDKLKVVSKPGAGTTITMYKKLK